MNKRKYTLSFEGSSWKDCPAFGKYGLCEVTNKRCVRLGYKGCPAVPEETCKWADPKPSDSQGKVSSYVPGCCHTRTVLSDGLKWCPKCGKLIEKVPL